MIADLQMRDLALAYAKKRATRDGHTMLVYVLKDAWYVYALGDRAPKGAKLAAIVPPAIKALAFIDSCGSVAR